MTKGKRSDAVRRRATKSPRTKPQDSRGPLIRACHAAVRAAGFDDDARHDFQMRVTGKASMRDMSVAELRHLRDELNRITGFGRGKGWRGKAAGRPRSDYHPPVERGDVRLIHALWGELGKRGVLKRPDRAGLNAFIRSRFEGHWSFVPVDVDVLTDTDNITDVIQALKAMLARAEKKSAS